MRLQGMNLKGFNIPDYKPMNPVSVPYNIKQHKYGALATWSHCTDTYGQHAGDAELHAFKYNLAMTVLISPITDGNASQYKEIDKTGRLKFGVYERTAHQITVDENANAEELIQEHYDNIYNGLSRYPSFASYGYGYQNFREEFKNYYLGVRNSNYNLANISYDIEDTSSLPMTTRQGDMPGTREEIMTLCEQALTNVINSGGWYTDFTHWHTVVDGELEEFFSNQRETIGNHNVVTLDFMTAIEYMKLRQSITEIKFFEADGKIYVTSELPYVPVFRRDINTTISVEVDLTGTILEGEEIKSNYGAQKLGNNIYIIEVPIDDYCIIESDLNGEYLDFELPTITNTSRNDTILTVITDKPTNVTVFETPLGGQTHQAILRKRSNKMSTVHYIDISDIAYLSRDLYIGAITEMGQSSLSDKYNF